MAVAERGIPRNPNFKRPLLRGLAWAMFTSGVAMSTYGIADAVSQLPEGFERVKEWDRKYPLIDQKELAVTQSRIVSFEQRSRDLIKEGKSTQLPQLVNETNVTQDYAKVDQHEKNSKVRRELSYGQTAMRSLFDVLGAGVGLNLAVGSLLIKRRLKEAQDK
jgi:hypothetical protein